MSEANKVGTHGRASVLQHRNASTHHQKLLSLRHDTNNSVAHSRNRLVAIGVVGHCIARAAYYAFFVAYGLLLPA